MVRDPDKWDDPTVLPRGSVVCRRLRRKQRFSGRRQRIGLRVTCRLALIVSLCLAASAVAAALDVPLCDTAPRIDADLTDPSWNSAAGRTGFRLLSTAEPAHVQTTIRLCRDDQWLYLAIRCEDPFAPTIVQSSAPRDSWLPLDDSVEIFIDPGRNGESWAHLVLTAGNVQLDQWCRGNERVRAWDIPWRSAAQVDPHVDTAEGWSAEAAIPLAALARNAGPGPWRLNICRNRRTVSPHEYTSLARLPPGSGFQAPEHFLDAPDLNGEGAAPVFGPVFDEVAASPLRSEKGHYYYEVKTRVRNIGKAGGEAAIVAQDVPSSGRGRQARRALALDSGQEKTVVLRLDVAGAATRAAWVELHDVSTAYVFERVDVPDMEALTPFDAYLGRNCYTGESAAHVYVEMRTGPPRRTENALVIVASLLTDKGKTAAEASATCDKKELMLTLPLTGVTPGSHRVRLRLKNKSDNALGTVDLALILERPAPDGVHVLKIDRYKRCLLLDDKPFFPLGAFGLGQHPLNEWQRIFAAAQYGYCRQAGFNFVCDWRGYAGTPASLEACRTNYNLAHSYGLRVVAKPYDVYGRDDLHYGNPKFREAALGLIDDMDPFLDMCRDHPAVIGYYHFDEPGGAPGIDDLVAAYTRKIHAVDRYHPVYMSLYQIFLLPERKSWFDTAADLLGAHCYWYPLIPDNLRSRAGRWHKVNLWSRQAHSPTMAAPQLDKWGYGYPRGGGFMLPDQQRAQTYLALVQGARSLMYFQLPFHHETSVKVQREICDQVRELAPALLSREPAQVVTFEPGHARFTMSFHEARVPGTGEWVFPLVLPSLRTYPSGQQVLLAVNPGSRALSVRFRVSSLTAESTVSEMFGDRRTFAVKAESFADDLAAFATRAYRLTATRPTGSKAVDIHLTMSGPAVDALGRDSVPAGKSQEGERNLVKNSGFEHARMAGYPAEWLLGVGEHLPPNEKASGQDDEEPFHGEHCLRLLHPHPRAQSYANHIIYSNRLKEGAYTLSAWLRADHPNARLRFYFGDKPRRIENITIGTTWQRYSVTANVTPGKRKRTSFLIWPLSKGTFYVDAVQLEEGNEPTVYESTD